MRRLAGSRVFKAALLGVLFFAVGCGSKDEESPPNYVVKEVQTGTTAGDAQGVTAAPKAGDTGQPTVGNSSIVREEVADNAMRENGTSEEDAPGADMEKPQKSDGIGDAKPAQEPQEGEGESGNTAKTEQAADVMSVDEMSLLPAGTVVDIRAFSEEELSACFHFEEVSDAVFVRMQGNSYPEDCTVALTELRYVRVLHYGFDGAVHIGELVVNRAIAQDIADIMKELFDARYPIEKMVLIDTYGGDDDASMADNNTSSFNFRTVEGTTTLSRHAYGLAVDINPLYNPYIPVRDGVPVVLPASAQAYADRGAECEYYIRHGDVCYNAFVSRGFRWGGDWETGKDYQHFSKAVE